MSLAQGRDKAFGPFCSDSKSCRIEDTCWILSAVESYIEHEQPDYQSALSLKLLCTRVRYIFG